jgi:transcriptional regulator with XRE-family HTH domain
MLIGFHSADGRNHRQIREHGGMMVIGDRLKELREAKKLSQGKIEERTGLLRCYISRVENNHTVPSIDTLEKLARALEVPMYQLFHSGEAAPDVRRLRLEDDDEWGITGRARDYVSQLAKALSQMKSTDRHLLLAMAHKVSKRR